MCGCFAYMHVCVIHMYPVPVEASTLRVLIPQDRSFRHSCAAMWMLEIESRSTGRIGSTLNC